MTQAITTGWLLSRGCKIVNRGNSSYFIEWAYYKDGSVSALRHGANPIWYLRPRAWGGKPKFRVKAISQQKGQ